MTHITMGSALVLAGLAATGCATRTVVVTDRRPGPSTAVTLGVPPGQLPPPGQCRVWIQGRPPGRQARARSCDGIVATAPTGALILYRPGRDRRIVRVRYVHSSRVGVVVRIRIFEAATGMFLRDAKP